jgi:hypothetical protein
MTAKAQPAFPVLPDVLHGQEIGSGCGTRVHWTPVFPHSVHEHCSGDSEGSGRQNHYCEVELARQSE